MTEDSAGRHRLGVGQETVQFTDRGHGEPLLLIHGGVFAAWFPTVADDPALSGFRLVMPVRAGYDPTARIMQSPSDSSRYRNPRRL